MEVPHYFGGKSHVSNGQKVSFQEPCQKPCLFNWVPCSSVQASQPSCADMGSLCRRSQFPQLAKLRPARLRARRPSHQGRPLEAENRLKVVQALGFTVRRLNSLLITFATKGCLCVYSAQAADKQIVSCPKQETCRKTRSLEIRN